VNDSRTRRTHDHGVPEALPRTLIRLREELGVERIDRMWIFPPSCRGRKERGLVVASVYADDDERRTVVTMSYTAEHTGSGVSVEPTLTRQGDAPPDRFPPIMTGVVRRLGEDAAEAREVAIEASARRFEELLEEFDGVFIEAPEV